MTSPDVLPSVSYRSMREGQLSGVKPSGQCILALFESGNQVARRGGNCQHRGGWELGLSGMVNTCESLLSVVTENKPKMLTGLDQKVSDQH
jgi:hypothetical protein